jgi:hypothetical protein
MIGIDQYRFGFVGVYTVAFHTFPSIYIEVDRIKIKNYTAPSFYTKDWEYMLLLTASGYVGGLVILRGHNPHQRPPQP